MTKKQIKLAARLLLVHYIGSLSEDDDFARPYDIEENLFAERAANRLSAEDRVLIIREIEEIGEQLLGKEIRFKNGEEIFNYCRKL